MAPSWDAGSVLNGHKNEAEYFMRQIPLNRERYTEIVSAGCGTGIYDMPALREFPDCHLTANDKSPDMIDVFKGKLAGVGKTKRVTFLQGDVREQFDKLLKERKGTFHFGMITSLLEHLKDHEAREVFGQMRDLLTPDGLLLHAAVKNNWFTRNLILGPCAAKNSRSREDNIKFATDAGFPYPSIRELPFRPLTYRIMQGAKEAHFFQKVPILSPVVAAQSHPSSQPPSRTPGSATQVPSGLPVPSST